MGPNEFTLQDDRVGFIEDRGELEEFLTLNSYTEELVAIDADAKRDVVRFYNSSSALPKINWKILLSDELNYLEREQYDFFTLLGDIGGFNGAITIFPSYLLSWYAAKMFNTSIYKDMPIKKKDLKRRSKNHKQAIDLDKANT